MRYTTIIIFFFLLCFCPFAKAQQNLVPNPSFEEMWECPAGAFTIMTCKDWFSVYPANGTQWTNTVSVPDYFHICSTGSSFDNYRGYQLPKTGVAYSIFLAYEQWNPDQRIYLECQLLSPLVKGEIYKVSFFVSLINKAKNYTNKIGIYLSEEKQEKFNYYTLDVIPQIMSSVKIKDTLNWVEITGNYRAIGGEKFLTIGNFFNDANSDLDTIPSPPATLAYVCYYYVDDVSVIACDTCEKDTSKTNILFIPDAFSPNGDGYNDKLFVRGNNIQELYFAVFDRWGEKVFETTDKNNGWDGTYKGSTLSGAVFVYYCKGKYTDGKEFKQKGDVTLVR